MLKVDRKLDPPPYAVDCFWDAAQQAGDTKYDAYRELARASEVSMRGCITSGPHSASSLQYRYDIRVLTRAGKGPSDWIK